MFCSALRGQPELPKDAQRDCAMMARSLQAPPYIKTSGGRLSISTHAHRIALQVPSETRLKRGCTPGWAHENMPDLHE